MGYGLEVEMIRLAHAKDMLTTPYVFGEADAAAMAEAGADIIVCDLGLTVGGAIAEPAPPRWNACRRSARSSSRRADSRGLGDDSLWPASDPLSPSLTPMDAIVILKLEMRNP